MNNNNLPDRPQYDKMLNIIWLVFLMNALFFPLVGFISNKVRSGEPILGNMFGTYVMLTVAVIFIIISHKIFQSISSKPISLQKFQSYFIISLVLAEVPSILGIINTTTSSLNAYSYILFGLGFLSVIIKKPNSNMILNN